MGMEDTLGRPVSQDRVDARAKEGIDNPKKAEHMAYAGDKARTSAARERQDNLKNPPGWLDRLLRKGMLEFKDDIADRREEFAGILYDVKLKFPEASEEVIEKIARVIFEGKEKL